MLPEKIYQMLPIAYLISGLGSLYILPMPYNIISGGILTLASLLVFRMRHENAAKKILN